MLWSQRAREVTGAWMSAISAAGSQPIRRPPRAATVYNRQLQDDTPGATANNRQQDDNTLGIATENVTSDGTGNLFAKSEEMSFYTGFSLVYIFHRNYASVDHVPLPPFHTLSFPYILRE